MTHTDIQARRAEGGKSATLIARWSSRHRWVKRVLSWQTDQDRLVQAAREEQIREAAQAHARLARSMRRLVEQRLEEIGNSKSTRPQGLAAWAKAAVQIERLALGMRTGENLREPAQVPDPSDAAEKPHSAEIPADVLRTVAEQMTPEEARAAAHAILRRRTQGVTLRPDESDGGGKVASENIGENGPAG